MRVFEDIDVLLPRLVYCRTRAAARIALTRDEQVDFYSLFSPDLLQPYQVKVWKEHPAGLRRA